MAKSLNDILQRYSDVISGKLPPSKIESLTTGENPGVDYADKMKDGRDFIAQHSVEKHPDRNGNGDDVFKGSTKKAEMERHGHEPKPKDIQVYNKTQQVSEEKEDMSGKTCKKCKKGKYVETSQHDDMKGVLHCSKCGSGTKRWALKEAKDEREYGYEGDMAITQLKTICRNAEHLMKMMKPDTDLPEWVQSKITKAEDYISTAHDYLMSEMNEEALDEIKKPLANYVKKRKEELKDFGDEDSIRRYNKKGETVGDQLGKDVKSRSNKYIAKAKTKLGEEVEELDEAKCNMTEAGKMCEVHGMKACTKEDNESASDKEPRYNGKKKEGRQLITDKKLQEMAASQNQAIAARIALQHKREGTMPPKGTASYSMMGMSEKQLHDYTKAKKGAPDKVVESLSDQRSAKATASEKAREKITAALEKRKLAKMKMEQSAPAETVIRMPSGEVGDTGRV